MRFFSVVAVSLQKKFETGGLPILVDTRCPLNSPSWSAITRPPHPTAVFLRERLQLLPAGGLGFADADVGEFRCRVTRLRDATAWRVLRSATCGALVLLHLRQQLAGADLCAHPQLGGVVDQRTVLHAA